MVNKQIQLTAQQREKGLIKTLGFSQELNFSPMVIQKYESQLKEVQAELQKDRNRKAIIREILKIDKQIEKSQDKGMVMDLIGKKQSLLDEINSN